MASTLHGEEQQQQQVYKPSPAEMSTGKAHLHAMYIGTQICILSWLGLSIGVASPSHLLVSSRRQGRSCRVKVFGGFIVECANLPEFKYSDFSNVRRNVNTDSPVHRDGHFTVLAVGEQHETALALCTSSLSDWSFYELLLVSIGGRNIFMFLLCNWFFLLPSSSSLWRRMSLRRHAACVLNSSLYQIPMVYQEIRYDNNLCPKNVAATVVY